MDTEQNAEDHFDENIERFSSDELIDLYTDRAEAGLFVEEERAIERYFSKSGGTVLDVGCGAGRTTAELHDRGFDVIGVDLSEEMVAAAQALFPDIQFRVDDATALGFGSEQFDYVLFSHNGIDYVHPESERLTALNEIHRVLKPGGTFVFSTHNTWYKYPALLTDRSFLKTFYLNRVNLGRLFASYKKDVREADLHTYMSNPLRQRRQLRQCGFSDPELIGKHGGPVKYFEAMLYFAANK